MSPLVKYYVCLAVMVCVIAGAALTARFGPKIFQPATGPIIGIGVLVVFALFIYFDYFIKCPQCGERLGDRKGGYRGHALSTRFCSFCGYDLMKKSRSN